MGNQLAQMQTSIRQEWLNFPVAPLTMRLRTSPFPVFGYLEDKRVCAVGMELSFHFLSLVPD